MNLIQMLQLIEKHRNHYHVSFYIGEYGECLGIFSTGSRGWKVNLYKIFHKYKKDTPINITCYKDVPEFKEIFNFKVGFERVSEDERNTKIKMLEITRNCHIKMRMALLDVPNLPIYGWNIDPLEGKAW